MLVLGSEDLEYNVQSSKTCLSRPLSSQQHPGTHPVFFLVDVTFPCHPFRSLHSAAILASSGSWPCGACYLPAGLGALGLLELSSFKHRRLFIFRSHGAFYRLSERVMLLSVSRRPLCMDSCTLSIPNRFLSSHPGQVPSELTGEHLALHLS